MFFAGRTKHVFLLLAVLALTAFFRWNGRASVFEDVFYRFNSSVTELGRTTLLPYGDVEKAKKRLINANEDRAKLLGMLADAKEEIRRLEFERKIAKTKRAKQKLRVTARVVGRAPSSWNTEVIADAGGDDGVVEGFIALTADGIIGRVTAVTNGTCVIRLITGNGTATSAMIAGKSIYGIIYGDGAGGMRMKSAPSHLNVQKGDLVTTSGLGEAYPADLPAGVVERVRLREELLSPIVDIAPVADLVNLTYVLLVEPK